MSPEELAAALARAEADGAAPTTVGGAVLAAADGAAEPTDRPLEFTSGAQPEAGTPAAKNVGNAVAAATVGASLLAFARPAMLRRRRLDDDA